MRDTSSMTNLSQRLMSLRLKKLKSRGDVWEGLHSGGSERSLDRSYLKTGSEDPVLPRISLSRFGNRNMGNGSRGSHPSHSYKESKKIVIVK